jgi:hypothetical protein
MFQTVQDKTVYRISVEDFSSDIEKSRKIDWK